MTDLNILFNLVFSIAVGGLATYGISTMIAIESGPFSIFDRMRESLLPDCDEDITPEPEPLPFGTVGAVTAELDLDTVELQEPPIFERTLRGTLHGILDCAICFGLWFSIFAATLPPIMGLMPWEYYPLTWLATNGLHRFLLGIAGDI